MHQEKPQKTPYDKDYKKLNKIASKNRVTTCQQQYVMRKMVDLRLKEPRSKNSTPQTFATNSQIHQAHSLANQAYQLQGSSMDGQSETKSHGRSAHYLPTKYDVAYGMANKPSTPIRSVINN